MSAPLSAATRQQRRSAERSHSTQGPIVHPGELPSGPASSHAAWSANSLSDQNAALWASLRPPARPSWPVLVRQRVSELSLGAVGERLHHGLPRWFGSRQTAQRWLLSATGGIVLGLALGVAARFAESPPSELEDPPIAAQPVAAPSVAAQPVAAPPVAASPVQDTGGESAPAREASPTVEPEAPRLAEPAPTQRAAVSKKKKKKLKATSKRRAQKRTRQRKRSRTSSR